MKLELRPVDDLLPDPRNARLHNQSQVEKLAALIDQFGYTNPILYDDHIRAGHGRQMAVRLLYQQGKRLRWPDGKPIPAGKVPVLDCTGWTEDQRRAYMLADNQIAIDSSWDEQKLLDELKALNEADFDLLGLGFTTVDISSILDGPKDDPAAHWRGMPQFQMDDKTAFRTLPVHFASQADVDRFAELVGQKITDKTRSLWYPEAEIERYADKQYE